jgi:DNA polymerase III subunit gamma/tau
MWDIKYRPKTFADTIGQQGTVQLLKARLSNGTALDTSYIFAGSWGSGKTTLSRIHARATMCQDLNKADPEPCNACDNCLAILDGSSSAFQEKDAASGGSLEVVREMLDDIPFALVGVAKRVWLFDESHKLTSASQNALLKPIEEKQVVGIFCTTEVGKILGPIRSRCEEYTIRKASREDLLKRMKHVLDTEGVQYNEDAVLTVIDFSGGHVRDILNRLEMVAQLGAVTIDNVRDYLNLGVVSDYYNILLSLGDPLTGLKLLEAACERCAPDEVAAGLAEAAMNSYRLAHGMFADFAYADKALSAKVFERFGQHTINLAEYFLRSRHVTRTALVADILSLSQSGGVPRAPTEVVGVPIVVTAPVANAQIAQVALNPTPAQAAQTIPATPLANIQITNKNIRPDGIGAVGSGDILALTSLDNKGVPQDRARMRNTDKDTHVPFGGVVDDEGTLLSPADWQKEFERTWIQRT